MTKHDNGGPISSVKDSGTSTKPQSKDGMYVALYYHKIICILFMCIVGPPDIVRFELDGMPTTNVTDSNRSKTVSNGMHNFECSDLVITCMYGYVYK